MPKKPGLNTSANEDLKNRALDYIARYVGDGETLRQHRETALKAYRRDPYPEDSQIPEGSRSKFVMSDVADTIEWILPSLMRIFYSGDDVVKIEGHGPEDERKVVGVDPLGQPITINPAGLLNEKVNFDFKRQNNGFMVLYDAFKSSMLDKFTVIKYWWDSHNVYVEENFTDLTEDQLMLLGQDPDYEFSGKPTAKVITEAQPIPLELGGGEIPAVSTYSVKGRRIRDRVQRPVAEVLPGEEFIGAPQARDFKTEEFVAHRKRIHKFDLMTNYGLDEDDLAYESSVFSANDSEIYERFKDLGGIGFYQDQQDRDFYYIHECYLNEETGGVRLPVKLTLLGNRVIDKEPNSYGHPPFCVGSPIRMPHRAIGHSIAELVTDIQKMRSSLARFILNNIYYQTDSMLVVNPDKVHVNDFLTNRRPGGIVRTKAGMVGPVSEAIQPLPPIPLAGHAYNLLETVEGWKENRTGVTRYNQGADADSLNKTATGISQIMSASQQRIELIARIYAETLVKDIMTAFARMNIDYLDKDRTVHIKLNQEWQAIDPRDLNVQYDVTVDVALGTGSRQERVQSLMGMMDRSLNPLMIQSGVIQKENVYELMKSLWIELGYKNPQKFVTDPKQLAAVQAALQQGMPNGPIGNAGPPPPGVGAGAGAIGPGQGTAPAPAGY